VKLTRRRSVRVSVVIAVERDWYAAGARNIRLRIPAGKKPPKHKPLKYWRSDLPAPAPRVQGPSRSSFERMNFFRLVDASNRADLVGALRFGIELPAPGAADARKYMELDIRTLHIAVACPDRTEKEDAPLSRGRPYLLARGPARVEYRSGETPPTPPPPPPPPPPTLWW